MPWPSTDIPRTHQVERVVYSTKETGKETWIYIHKRMISKPMFLQQTKLTENIEALNVEEQSVKLLEKSIGKTIPLN